MKANTLAPLAFLFLALLVGAGSSLAQIVVMQTGDVYRGTINGFNDNVVRITTADDYLAIPLTDVREIRVSEGASGATLEKQQAIVARAKRVLLIEAMHALSITTRVRTLLKRRQYATLTKLEKFYLLEEQKTPKGYHNIEAFYEAFDLDTDSAGRHEEMMEQLGAWKKAEPDSLAAALAWTTGLTAQAWAIRGHGFASTLTKKRSRHFRELVTLANHYLDTLYEHGVRHPSMFEQLITTGMASGASREKMSAWMQASRKAFPNYLPAYKAYSEYSLPRWRGTIGAPAEVASWVLENNDDQGYDNYYRLTLGMWNRLPLREFVQHGYDWSSALKGFEIAERNALIDDRSYHQIARMAVELGDYQSALKYFDKTDGEWNHFAKRVWKDKAVLKRYQDWAASPPSSEYIEIAEHFESLRFAIVTRMLEKFSGRRSDLNTKDLPGNTLLHYAVRERQQNIAVWLLENGADPGILDDWQWSPLHWAADRGNLSMVRLLLKHGANPLTTNKWGITPAYLAAKNGYTPIVAEFVNAERKLLTTPTESGRYLLHATIKGGHVDTLRYLLKQREALKIAKTESNEWSLATLAVTYRHPEVLAILIKSGARLDVVMDDGYTPLGIAKHRKFEEMVAMLEKAGAPDKVVKLTAEERETRRALTKSAFDKLRTGDYPGAKQDMLALLEIEPDSARVTRQLAMAMFSHGAPSEWEEADRYMLEAIRLNPDDPELIYWRGRLNHKLNRPDIYKPLFIKYVELAPDTYNSQDLKKNYASYLKPDSAGVPTAPTAWWEGQEEYLALALVSLLILLVGVRLTNRRAKATDSNNLAAPDASA